MRLSFKTKALLIFCPIIILISIAYTLTAIRTEHNILREEIIKRGEVLATVAVKDAELPILSKNPVILRDAAASLGNIQNVNFVIFYNQEFEPIMHVGEPTAKPSSPNIAMEHDRITIFEKKNLFEFYAPVFCERTTDDVQFYEEIAPDQALKSHIGWVRIGLSKEAMTKTGKTMARKGALTAALMAGAAVALLTLLLNTVLLRPLNALLNAVKGLQAGQYPQIELIDSNDEFSQLVAEFNKMSLAIEDREKQLVHSQKKIKRLFERVEHAIFRLDSDCKIIESNMIFKELCDTDAAFFNLLPEEARKPLYNAAINGKLAGFEVDIRAKDNTTHTILLSVYPEINVDKSIAGFEGYFVDITEKKNLEEALHQKQKLESLGLLAGGIAHDFNNILTGILGYASELKHILPAGEVKGHAFLETIEKSSERAANLVRQLLSFARKGKIRPVSLDINALLQDITEFLKETFDRNITIELSLGKDMPRVNADSTQLYQAIMNLCINARDAMSNGGRLSLASKRHVLTEELVTDSSRVPTGEYVLLQVTDNGKGMTSEVKKRILEPFFTTKEEGRGTGLGLSMAYGIVENHNGHIIISSEEGKGTAIDIFLPAAEKGAAIADKVAAKPIPLADGNGRTILLIDDEYIIRELAREILESNNFNILMAKHGAEGAKIYEEAKERIDLVVLDMIMPEMGGKETFHAIKTLDPAARVLVCSGFSEKEPFDELLQAGAVGYIQKPFRRENFLYKVAEALPVEEG